mmetsp:Transcript_3988/g.5264  ORF Transcript_3988/g.5264 Transcript_3988/m.5264 type:complete len:236 (+) Transcript_3988:488-1195(+)
MSTSSTTAWTFARCSERTLRPMEFSRSITLRAFRTPPVLISCSRRHLRKFEPNLQSRRCCKILRTVAKLTLPSVPRMLLKAGSYCNCVLITFKLLPKPDCRSKRGSTWRSIEDCPNKSKLWKASCIGVNSLRKRELISVETIACAEMRDSRSRRHSANFSRMVCTRTSNSSQLMVPEQSASHSSTASKKAMRSSSRTGCMPSCVKQSNNSSGPNSPAPSLPYCSNRLLKLTRWVS